MAETLPFHKFVELFARWVKAQDSATLAALEWNTVAAWEERGVNFGRHAYGTRGFWF